MEGRKIIKGGRRKRRGAAAAAAKAAPATGALGDGGGERCSG